MVEKLKAWNSAVRRSATFPNDIKLTAEDVVACVNVELGTGHYNYTYNWTEEQEKKGTPTPLPETWDSESCGFSGESFLNQAKPKILGFMQQLLGDAALQEQTFEDAFRDRHGYEVGGATSEGRFQVPAQLIDQSIQILLP